MINQDQVIKILNKCWSVESCSKYTNSNPALGQCSVTSIVIQRKYGGQILKTKTDNRWHFYNEINGEAIDFTKDQFTEPIEYLNMKSSRAEALQDCSEAQVNYLWLEFSRRSVSSIKT